MIRITLLAHVTIKELKAQLLHCNCSSW